MPSPCPGTVPIRVAHAAGAVLPGHSQSKAPCCPLGHACMAAEGCKVSPLSLCVWVAVSWGGSCVLSWSMPHQT